MIVSYHPCYEADTNILCAGRKPDENDRATICEADAVILSQGCSEELYSMARAACAHVFPNYDVRFQYPGKTGQARLFQETLIPHPKSFIFHHSTQLNRFGRIADATGFPLVLKLDWGGEGDTVFLLKNHSDLDVAMAKVTAYERTGQKGFVLQEFIPGSQRTLRVVVIGQLRKAYWRVQKDPYIFGTSVAKGAYIDTTSEPLLQKKGTTIVSNFCRHTNINLAGFDVLFNATESGQDNGQPLMLEINHFFGRTGLGGSEAFYAMLQSQIDGWLESLGVRIREKTGAQR